VLVEQYKKIRLSGEQFTYDETPVNITDAISFDADKSIRSTADGFSFRVMNTKIRGPAGGDIYLYDGGIKVGDRIIIYITCSGEITDSNKNDYRRFDGIVKETDYTESVDGNFVIIRGANRFEIMMNYTFIPQFKDRVVADDDTDNISGTESILQTLIDNVNDNNPQNPITYSPNNDKTGETTDTNANTISYYRNYMPVYEIIQEISRQNINGRFNALYYLDNDNNFIWQQKSTDNDTVVIEEGVDPFKIKNGERLRDVFNAIIVDCGKDPAGRGIHTQFVNEARAAEFGLRYFPNIQVNIVSGADTIITEQRTSADTTGWVDNADPNKKNFPSASAYPMTLTIPQRTDTGDEITGTNVVVKSDAEWIEAIRLEAKWQGARWGKDVVAHTGDIRPNIDLEFQGCTWELGANRTGAITENLLNSSGNPITQGDTVKFIFVSRGDEFDSGVLMRVVQVNHEISRRGWITTMRLKYDVEDIQSRIQSGHTATT
jgi:hypothetical protein